VTIKNIGMTKKEPSIIVAGLDMCYPKLVLEVTTGEVIYDIVYTSLLIEQTLTQDRRLVKCATSDSE